MYIRINSWVNTEMDNFRVRMGLVSKTEPLLDRILKEDDGCVGEPPVEDVDSCTVTCFGEDPFNENDIVSLKLPDEGRFPVTWKEGEPTSIKLDLSDVWNCLPQNMALESYLYKVRQANRLQGKQIDAKQKLVNQIKDQEKAYIRAQNIFIQRKNELEVLNKNKVNNKP